MQKIVELKIEETKAVVGGTRYACRAVAAERPPSSRLRFRPRPVIHSSTSTAFPVITIPTTNLNE